MMRYVIPDTISAWADALKDFITIKTSHNTMAVFSNTNPSHYLGSIIFRDNVIRDVEMNEYKFKKYEPAKPDVFERIKVPESNQDDMLLSELVSPFKVLVLPMKRRMVKEIGDKNKLQSVIGTLELYGSVVIINGHMQMSTSTWVKARDKTKRKIDLHDPRSRQKIVGYLYHLDRTYETPSKVSP